MNKSILKPVAIMIGAALLIVMYISLMPNNLHSNQWNIIIDAIPKSGSTYITEVLRSGLGYTRTNIFPTKTVTDNKFHTIREFYSKSNRIATQHLRAPNSNSEPGAHLGPPILPEGQLNKYTDRKVVHFCDPRGVLLSLVHYVNLHKDISQVYPNRPEGYYNLSLEAQIDWGIDNFLPRIVTWMQEWIDYKDKQDASKHGLKILFTTYDELVQNELDFYQKILKFYSIPPQNFTFNPPVKEQMNNFRKGDPNEWRQVFTEKQKQKIATIVPDKLLQRFNWEK